MRERLREFYITYPLDFPLGLAANLTGDDDESFIEFSGALSPFALGSSGVAKGELRRFLLSPGN